MASLVTVDDFNSSILYSTGWMVFTGGQEVGGTKHDTGTAGMTATLEFTGTFVTVVGTLGAVDLTGIPTSHYAIDGTVVGNYTAPVIDPGFYELNVTYFTSLTLTPGKHRLVITNMNGTAPNVFQLDYIQYLPSADSSTISSQSTVGSSSIGTLSSSQTTASSASSSLSSSSTVGSPTATADAATTTSKSTARLIIGGLVGGIAGVVIVGIFAWWWFWRRMMNHVIEGGQLPEGIHPFPTWYDAGIGASLGGRPTPPTVEGGRKQLRSQPSSPSGRSGRVPSSGNSSTAAQRPLGGVASRQDIPPQPVHSSPGPLIGEPGTIPVLAVEVDSGVRIGQHDILPPPYTQH